MKKPNQEGAKDLQTGAFFSKQELPYLALSIILVIAIALPFILSSEK